jgi:site-specific DNA-methyltransferase (adenine-specific)
MIEQHLYNGDSADVLKELKDNSVDMLATDPPYGIQFMGLDFDKALPPKEVWSECYRVLKPGSFIAVMSSPRSDVLYRMIKDLEDAGFDMSFSPIMWAYHSGFPKASDVSKMLEKRGVDDELVEKYNGAKSGFQPKPAVEHIIIGMKPHGSKSYIDNVLNFEALPDNIKMTYPFIQVPKPSKGERNFGMEHKVGLFSQRPRREDGTIIYKETHPDEWKEAMDKLPRKDKTSKAAAEEKLQDGNDYKGNKHPTIKPVKLMSYIITLFTREGDWVMDPFLGSGTSGLASKLLNRNFIGVEREKEYFDICEERLSVSREELVKFFKMEKDTQTKLDL